MSRVKIKKFYNNYSDNPFLKGDTDVDKQVEKFLEKKSVHFISLTEQGKDVVLLAYREKNSEWLFIQINYVF